MDWSFGRNRDLCGVEYLGVNGVFKRPDDKVGRNGELLRMSIVDYPYKMIRDGRVVSITDDGKIVAIVFFSLCNDETQHLWNFDYEYHPHNPDGKILVLEGLVSKNFTFKIVKKMKEVFYNKFPQIEKTVWRRDKRASKKSTLRRHHEFHYSDQVS